MQVPFKKAVARHCCSGKKQAKGLNFIKLFRKQRNNNNKFT